MAEDSGAAARDREMVVRAVLDKMQSSEESSRMLGTLAQQAAATAIFLRKMDEPIVSSSDAWAAYLFFSATVSTVVISITMNGIGGIISNIFLLAPRAMSVIGALLILAWLSTKTLARFPKLPLLIAGESALACCLLPFMPSDPILYYVAYAGCFCIGSMLVLKCVNSMSIITLTAIGRGCNTLLRQKKLFVLHGAAWVLFLAHVGLTFRLYVSGSLTVTALIIVTHVWMYQVLCNVLEATLQGVTARATIRGRQESTDLRSAIRRSWGVFGTICVASLFSAITFLLRMMVSIKLGENGGDDGLAAAIISAVIRHALAALQVLVDKVGRFSLTWGTMTGSDFWSGAARMEDMMKIFTESPEFGSEMTTLSTAGAMGLLAWFVASVIWGFEYGALAGVLAFLYCRSLLASAVDGYCTTVLVCIAAQREQLLLLPFNDEEMRKIEADAEAQFAKKKDIRKKQA